MKKIIHSITFRYAVPIHLSLIIGIILWLVFLLLSVNAQAQWTINAANTNFTQNFNGMGGTTALPAGFQIISPRSAAPGFVDYSADAGSLAVNQTGAAYNFGVGSDRSIGVLNSSSYTSGKYIVLHIVNNTGSVINEIDISWRYEKYRSGSRSWTWNFYHGANPVPAIIAPNGNQTYAADGDNATNINPPTSVSKSTTITNLNIAAGSSYYFRWVLTGSGGHTNGQGLSIDDVVISLNSACTPGIPAVALGNDISYCDNETFSMVLNAQNAGASYLWSNGATTQAITASTAGTYSVKVTDSNGCIGNDTIVVTEKPAPVINLGNDTAYCAGTPFSLLLNAQNTGATYDWNDGAAGTPTFTAISAGTYKAEASFPNGCSAIDSIIITEYALPTINLGNDTGFCATSTFNLVLNAGNPGATYSWNNGASSTQTYAITQEGTYSVSVTDVNGCINSDEIVVTENTLPTVALGNDTAYCVGTTFSLLLDAEHPGSTYQWNNGTIQTQTYTVSQAGTYSVSVTDVNGCVGSDEIVVTEHIIPVVNLGNDTAYCANTTFSLELDAANTGSTYEWNNGGIQTQTYTATQAGTYSVSVTDVNGCIGFDQLTITERIAPPVNLGNDTAYCAGTSFLLLLDATNPNSTYSWNGGAFSAPIFVVTYAGPYWVTVTDNHGCFASDSILVTERTLPNANLGNDTSYCTGSTFSLLLNVQNSVGSTYVWGNGSITPTVTATQAGLYSVTVTDPNGCINRDTLVVSEVALPNIDLGNDMSVSGNSHTLNAGSGFSTYRWLPGNQTTQQITVNQSGTYIAFVTNSSGCAASDTINITFTNSVSIDEVNTKQTFTVFPNPSSGIVNIIMTEDGKYLLKLINMTGQTVWQQNEWDQTMPIDLSTLPSGTYLLQVAGKQFFAVERLVLTH